MNQDEEQYFYFTLMDFAELVNNYGADIVFNELLFAFPEIHDQFKTYLCNMELADLAE